MDCGSCPTTHYLVAYQGGIFKWPVCTRDIFELLQSCHQKCSQGLKAGFLSLVALCIITFEVCLCPFYSWILFYLLQRLKYYTMEKIKCGAQKGSFFLNPIENSSHFFYSHWQVCQYKTERDGHLNWILLFGVCRENSVVFVVVYNAPFNCPSHPEKSDKLAIFRWF